MECKPFDHCLVGRCPPDMEYTLLYHFHLFLHNFRGDSELGGSKISAFIPIVKVSWKFIKEDLKKFRQDFGLTEICIYPIYGLCMLENYRSL